LTPILLGKSNALSPKTLSRQDQEAHQVNLPFLGLSGSSTMEAKNG